MNVFLFVQCWLQGVCSVFNIMQRVIQAISVQCWLQQGVCSVFNIMLRVIQAINGLPQNGRFDIYCVCTQS